MKNILKIIKSWLHKYTIIPIDSKQLQYNTKRGFWKYEFLKLLDNEILINHVYSTALKVANSEDVPVRTIPISVMNKGVSVEKHAAGKFVYLPSRVFVPGELPRIELTDKYIWTFIHELGHYFRYKRNKPQSEDVANNYTLEFFHKHLPPFFRWVFQISIDTRVKGNGKYKDYTDYEAYEHFLECEKFLKNNC
jgi:hypothetical protein